MRPKGRLFSGRHTQLNGEIPDREPDDEEKGNAATEPSDLSDRFDWILAFAEEFIRGTIGGNDDRRRLGIENMPRVKLVPEHRPASSSDPRPV